MNTLSKILQSIKNELGKKYITEKGVDNNWNYNKYSDGTFEATINTQLAIDAGTAFCGGYFHKTTYPLALPSFAENTQVKNAVKQGTNLASFLGDTGVANNAMQFYWFNGTAGSQYGATFGKVAITIIGTYGGVIANLIHRLIDFMSLPLRGVMA